MCEKPEVSIRYATALSLHDSVPLSRAALKSCAPRSKVSGPPKRGGRACTYSMQGVGFGADVRIGLSQLAVLQADSFCGALIGARGLSQLRAAKVSPPEAGSCTIWQSPCLLGPSRP